MHTIPGQAAACDFDNPPEAQYCGSCGQQLHIVCPHCHIEVPAGYSFCTGCGTPLAATAAGTPSASPAAVQEPAVVEPTSERRLVSVLFCDLVDFTGLAEALDPEVVRDVLSRYFEAARESVTRYGGTIEKFIGDAVVAVWGSPVAHEDDPERAVRAALELVDAVSRLHGADPSRALAARAAVATGESAVIIGLEGQGMVAGDIVNTAARLQSVAPAGAVLINQTTRQATAGVIAARPAGRQRLKGKTAPVRSWRAMRPMAAGREQSPHPEPPFVDRVRELNELVATYESVVRNARSRLVSVIGIPGIGKSRLVRELGRRVAEGDLPAVWFVGRTPAHGTGSPFGAVADMVREQLRIANRDGAEVARRKLRSALPEFAIEDGERAWIQPRLEVLLDPAGEHGYEREELFSAWRRFWELLSTRAPLVLIFEDAHRADPGLLDFVEQCVESARNRPMLLITVARTELLEHRPGWGAGLRNFTSLHLEKVPNEDLAGLLAGLASDLSPRVVAEALRRADGVPLYAVEMARMLEARRSDDARIAAATGVPSSLHALIAARIDSLPAAQRGLLLSAAVLGPSFTLAEVAAVAGASPIQVRPSVDRLVRQQILAANDDPRHAPAGRFGFQEQLVQEIAYRTLARRDRRRGHLAAAQYVEALGDEERVEVLADHLMKAYQADPGHADAAAIAERAQPVLLQAAHRARALHAPDRALAHLTDAISLSGDLAERAALTEEAAAAAQAAGRFDVSERYWRELVELRTATGDAAGAARATARLASLLFLVVRNDAGLAEVEAALRRLGDVSQDDPAAVELAGQLARAYFVRGDASEARTWADRALRRAERLGLRAVASDALITRGTALLSLGDTTAGVQDLNRAIAQCEDAELLGLELRARNNLAWLLVGDDPRRTLDAARRGFELGHQKGLRDMALQLASVAMVTAVDTGDWDWALETIDQLDDEAMAPAHHIDLAATGTILRALRGLPHPDQPLVQLEPFPSTTDPQILAQVSYARAWVAFLGGRAGRARQLAQEAVPSSVGFSRNAALLLSARAALWAGDDAQARADLEAIINAPPAGRAVIAAVRTIGAGADAVAGRRSEAAAGYRAAIRTWRTLDLPLPLALAVLERDTFLGPTSRTSTDAGGDASEIIARLRAVGLKRLARRAAGTPRGRVS